MIYNILIIAAISAVLFLILAFYANIWVEKKDIYLDNCKLRHDNAILIEAIRQLEKEKEARG